jgi:thiopurine S-methyltransferase
MEIEFWAQRWKEGRIGFHEGRANQFLQKHASKLGDARGGGKRVLVPLCGKTEDLAFLAAQGFEEVVGVEVVEDAVKAFFAEHELTPSVTDKAHGRVYAARGITLHVADFFACTKTALGDGPFDAFYDRAALVALPEEMRAKYVAHLRTLLKDDPRGIVITFEYDAAEFTPPPFAVLEAEVRALYKSRRVEPVDSGAAPGVRFKEAGISVTERVFVIT